ncbi:MAG TPA: hypothetical protein PLU10_06285 [Chitinophagaceae bacterium]|nr:hypothetical protein [Chitinophagaceae bacterium]
MPSKHSNIPDEILEWVSQLSFDDLSHDQKMLVNDFMSEEEYLSLHETHTLLSHGTTTHETSSQQLDFLLTEFDKHHVPNEISSWKITNKQFGWKVASVLFFCSTLYFAYRNFSSASLPPQIIVQHDTLFSPQPIAPIQHTAMKITKTQPIPLKSMPSKRKNQTTLPRISQPITQQKTSVENTPFNSTAKQTLPIYTSNRFNEVCNSAKGNRMKDDSIAQNFKYVSL